MNCSTSKRINRFSIMFSIGLYNIRVLDTGLKQALKCTCMYARFLTGTNKSLGLHFNIMQIQIFFICLTFFRLCGFRVRNRKLMGDGEHTPTSTVDLPFFRSNFFQNLYSSTKHKTFKFSNFTFCRRAEKLNFVSIEQLNASSKIFVAFNLG